jgi:hypothetical protein
MLASSRPIGRRAPEGLMRIDGSMFRLAPSLMHVLVRALIDYCHRQDERVQEAISAAATATADLGHADARFQKKFIAQSLLLFLKENGVSMPADYRPITSEAKPSERSDPP